MVYWVVVVDPLISRPLDFSFQVNLSGLSSKAALVGADFAQSLDTCLLENARRWLSCQGGRDTTSDHCRRDRSWRASTQSFMSSTAWNKTFGRATVLADKVATTRRQQLIAATCFIAWRWNPCMLTISVLPVSRHLLSLLPRAANLN